MDEKKEDLESFFQQQQSPELEIQKQARIDSEMIRSYALLLKTILMDKPGKERMSFISNLALSTSFRHDTELKKYIKLAKYVMDISKIHK